MRLDVKGMALAAGILWGGAIAIIGFGGKIIGVTEGGYYGKDFLLAMASIYPGYRGVPETGDILVGAGYGLVDGIIAGALLAWLYNRFARAG